MNKKAFKIGYIIGAVGGYILTAPLAPITSACKLVKALKATNIMADLYEDDEVSNVEIIM